MAFLVSATGAAVGTAFIGIAFERFLFRRVLGRPELVQLLLTYSIVLVSADLVRMVWGSLGKAHGDEAASLLADVGLGGRGWELAGALGHGDRRQLELAVALAQRPSILLLDEPMAGMAPAETRRCAALVERLARDRGLALLFTEHDMEVVFGMADRVAVLHHGELVADGLPGEVRADRRVRDIYLGRAA